MDAIDLLRFLDDKASEAYGITGLPSTEKPFAKEAQLHILPVNILFILPHPLFALFHANIFWNKGNSEAEVCL